MTFLRISSLWAAFAITTSTFAQTPATPDYSFTGKTVQSAPRTITRWVSSRYETGAPQSVQVESKAALLKLNDGSEKAYTCDELEDLAIKDSAKNISANTHQAQKISDLNQTELDKAWRGANCITPRGNENPRFIRAPKARVSALTVD